MIATPPPASGFVRRGSRRATTTVTARNTSSHIQSRSAELLVTVDDLTDRGVRQLVAERILERLARSAG